MSLVAKAHRTLRDECGVEKGSAILVACSGGPDSAALLHMLSRESAMLGIERIGVYHLNHSLRGSEADADEEFTRRLAETYGLPFYWEKKDVAEYAGKKGISVEMAGRELRYSGIRRFTASEGYQYAALGHTADDNLEWIILSLARGRAEPLLWGIPARRGHIIRPLLRCPREEVKAYLTDQGLSWRKDSTNLEVTCPRNFVRHRILPLYRELNPSFEKTLSRTLMLGDASSRDIEAEARGYLAANLNRRGGVAELDTSGLSDYNLITQLRTLRLFAPWLSADDLLGLVPVEAASGTREVARRGSKRLLFSYHRLIIQEAEPQPVWEEGILDVGQDFWVPHLGFRLRAEVGEGKKPRRCSDTVYFDAGEIAPPFLVRPWKDGDRMVPFARTGEVKLKELFINQKVPANLRRYWPVVCRKDRVIWVPGVRRSAAAPVTQSTRRLTILSFKRGEDAE